MQPAANLYLQVKKDGFAIDQDKLAADILQALNDKKFDAKIAATGNTVAPEISASSAKEKYKTISSFTTNTTANKNRNTNVRLAAEAINGTVIKPGQEFSFNGYSRTAYRSQRIQQHGHGPGRRCTCPLHHRNETPAGTDLSARYLRIRTHRDMTTTPPKKSPEFCAGTIN